MKLRPIVLAVGIMILCVILVPAVIVQFMPKKSTEVTQVQPVEAKQAVTQNSNQAQNGQDPQIMVEVYRTQSGSIERVPLEEYIIGVVASEMPSDFEHEALKAQALAARTYIIKRLVEKDFSDSPSGSVVTDTIQHQVYQNVGELKKRWGADFKPNYDKISQAVKETEGKVLTYQGRPINATFFSTSNGFTENSEDYWGAKLPYLRSVESRWDTVSPRFENSVMFSVEEFERLLETRLTQPVSSNQPVVSVLSRTEGNRIDRVQVGDKTYTGKEVRERLGIDSSHFDIVYQNGSIHVKTRGYGHGVGLSQWGAHGMAQEGYNAEEIVKHYYQDIQIADYRNWIVSRNES